MVSSLILLRSLRVYILKQLFFSISVNSGFRNIYLATSWLGKYFATIHLDFKEDLLLAQGSANFQQFVSNRLTELEQN